MSKTFFKGKIWFVITILSIACGILGFYVFRGYSLSDKYRRELENTYRHSLTELSEYMSNIENTLQKGLYVNTSKQQHNIAALLLSESNGAVSAMSRLPLANINLENVSKFISQVGDFAIYISGELSSGKTLSDDEIKSLHELFSYAKKVNENIKNVISYFSDGKNILDISESINENSGDEPYVNTGFKELNEVFVDYPTLIYDGPFSDHITRREPKLLQDASDINEDEQKKVAAKFLNVEENSLRKIGESGGNLPLTKFAINENIEISVTKKGGYVNYMINSLNSGESVLSTEDAVNVAKEFLKSQGYDQMKESYFSSVNGICTINFAYIEDNITCYSDLIKVGVSLDNGEIMFFEATGYIMNHVKRSRPENIISLEEAKKSLNQTLEIKEYSMAFSPTSGLNEVLCYEFECYSMETNEHVLIYVNAETGYEEKIFIVRTSQDGTVVV